MFCSKVDRTGKDGRAGNSTEKSDRIEIGYETFVHLLFALSERLRLPLAQLIDTVIFEISERIKVGNQGLGLGLGQGLGLR